jgi:uncharacterized protein YggL (DUF469 family)
MTAPCPDFGFFVAMQSDARLDARGHDRLRSDWMAFIEGRGLYCAAGASAEEYVVGSESSQATQNDRAAVEAWLAARDDVRAWRVGDLIDLREAV